MMSMSFEASCFRIANINSCLRMVDAFSTLCSSAKPSNSTGDFDLRSWSFISRMRVVPMRDRPQMPIDVMTGRNRRSLPEADAAGQIQHLRPDTAVGPFAGRGRQYQPAFGEMR